MKEKEIIKKRLKNLPDSPGIYKMINAEGAVIYIGKAKNLKKRVKQYFQSGYSHSTRTKKLVENAEDIELITVDSDLEATILEHNLIKQLKPKYNVIMKDDKNYVYIKITKEDYPRIQIVRNIEKDKAKYIGPKTASNKVKESFKILKRIFPFRHCNLNITEQENQEPLITNKVIKYPCLDYFIKRCAGPCIGKIDAAEYRSIIKNVENFFEGKTEEVIKDLKEKMVTQAANKEFEKAAKTRDQLLKIEAILEKQKISDPNQEDKDVVNFHIQNQKAFFNLFQIRDGKLIGQENFILAAEEIEDEENNEEVLSSFLNQYYEITNDIPKEILIPTEVPFQDEIESHIRKISEKNVKIIIPKIGTKNKLLEMSLNNAKIYADRNKPKWQEESHDSLKSIQELQKVLGLEKTPKRIECYDISHLSGTDTVGSMIVFENGAPNKAMYRKFQLKTVKDKPDDFKSLQEVLKRRLQKIKKEEPLKIKKNKEILEIRAGEKVIAEAKIIEVNTKISLINLQKIEKNFLHEVFKKLIEKAKSKRIYIQSPKKLEEKESLLTLGFEELRNQPKELTEGEYLAFDKNKHKEDKSFKQIPDLIIIDGGKGQLAAAREIIAELNFLHIPHISLAKRLEEIFVPEKSASIRLESNHEALKLIQRARDEAHRFAITYNKKLRSHRIKK